MMEQVSIVKRAKFIVRTKRTIPNDDDDDVPGCDSVRAHRHHDNNDNDDDDDVPGRDSVRARRHLQARAPQEGRLPGPGAPLRAPLHRARGGGRHEDVEDEGPTSGGKSH